MCCPEIHSFCRELNAAKDSLHDDALISMEAFRAFHILNLAVDGYFILFNTGLPKDARVNVAIQEMERAVELWPAIHNKVCELKSLIVAIERPPACWAL